jgi:hypothetical protein
MTFLKVATPRMDEEQHEVDVQYPMIDLARDGLISVVEHRPLKLSAVRWPICPTVSARPSNHGAERQTNAKDTRIANPRVGRLDCLGVEANLSECSFNFNR